LVLVLSSSMPATIQLVAVKWDANSAGPEARGL
jgi:hypothetical protein